MQTATRRGGGVLSVTLHFLYYRSDHMHMAITVRVALVSGGDLRVRVGVSVRVRKLQVIDQDEAVRSAGEGGERSTQRSREAHSDREELGHIRGRVM